jgi:photosystem II stability/assembly factor-like uncharacterized protein
MIRLYSPRLTAATLALAIGAATGSLSAQTTGPVATEFAGLHFRSIGPTVMSGRIADIAVYEANPAIWYVGTAHGGVWKTTSNGALFTPMLQDQGLMSIGAVEVSQINPDIVWAATGESNNRQSTSWGEGVYKSTNGGATWQHMGLRNSKHINRMVMHPTNNDIVFVAATGPLYGPGGERGVYKTTDGGRTWRQVLRVDDMTGANDIVMSAIDPNTMYASMYQRQRSACCMNLGGPGSGIWKSTDGGETWTRITGNGLPTGTLGRIGLDMFRKSNGIVFALVETVGGGGGGGRGGRGGAAGAPAGGAGRGGAVAGGAAAAGAAAAADPAGGMAQEGAQAGGGSGVYRSDDGGATWRLINAGNPRPMYFSQIRVDPNTPERFYLGGVGLWQSHDAGRTIDQDVAVWIHDDIHSLWINPANSSHLIMGGDGGVATSYDMARTWTHLTNLPVGLFYHVGFDNSYPYNICGGMQDNYNWCGPSRSRFSGGILLNDWFQIQGGDGFVAIPDPQAARFVYTESQDGGMTRRNVVTGESRSIRPAGANILNPTAITDPGTDCRPTCAFHWDAVLQHSTATTGVLYAAGKRVFKSADRGETWTVISGNLTTANRDTMRTMGRTGAEIGSHDGIQQWPTIVTLGESPKSAQILYAGTDDGNVQMTKDAGRTWTNITSRIPGFPVGSFVSEVVPSRFDAGRVYVTVENHRLNDYNPYIWVSNDTGKTFTAAISGLAGQVVRSITEDTKNQDVLYIGTETGIFLTLDRARTWRRLQGNNFPTVRVDELTIHPRENALLVASHGRALWILDALGPIQDYQPAMQGTADARLAEISPVLLMKTWNNQNANFWGHQFFVGENPPNDAVISYIVKRPLADGKLRITDAMGKVLRTMPIPANRNTVGIQTVCWDMRMDGIAAGDGGGAGAAGAAGPGGRGGGGGAGAAGAAGAADAGRGGRGAAGGGGGAGGGGRGAGGNTTGALPQPQAGYRPSSPCGGGGGGGGGGPQVLSGTYNVALMAGDKVLDTKQLKVVFDPEVAQYFTAADQKRWSDIVMDLHDMQGKLTERSATLSAISQQLTDSNVAKAKASTKLSAAEKGQVDALDKAMITVRPAFGIARISGAPAAPVGAAAPGAGGGGRGGRGGGGGGGGGGGRGGAGAAGAGADANVLGRVGTLKTALMGAWEAPSSSQSRQYNEVKAAYPKAISDADAAIARARAANEALKKEGITLPPIPPAR